MEDIGDFLSNGKALDMKLHMDQMRRISIELYSQYCLNSSEVKFFKQGKLMDITSHLIFILDKQRKKSTLITLYW